MFKRKQERKTKRLTYQPFHLAKMSFSMKTNTVTYIWKKLLAAGVELPNITECRWQSSGDTHWLDELISTEIEDLLLDGDDNISDKIE